MDKEKIASIIAMALGRASTLFMTKEVKGTEIIMPSEELAKITDETAEEIVNLKN